MNYTFLLPFSIFIVLLIGQQIILNTYNSREGLSNHKGNMTKFRIYWNKKVSRPIRKTWEALIHYIQTHILRPIKHHL
jgi:NADH:ubiquinone oxidoreductase subunit